MTKPRRSGAFLWKIERQPDPPGEALPGVSPMAYLGSNLHEDDSPSASTEQPIQRRFSPVASAIPSRPSLDGFHRMMHANRPQRGLDPVTQHQAPYAASFVPIHRRLACIRDGAISR